MKKITIDFIAEKSGVSKSTVSRYLNGGYVSDKNRQIISKNIEKYKYIPNKFAQSLKAKKTGLIGVIIPRFDSDSGQRFLTGLDKSLKELGFRALIFNTGLSIDQEIEAIMTLYNMKVDGIILLASSITKKHEQLVEDLTIPLILVGQKYDKASYIIYDDYKAGGLMAQYFIDKGVDRLYYFGVSEVDRAVGYHRKKGVLDRVKTREGLDLRLVQTDFSSARAERAAEKNLLGPGKFYVIAATDNIAMGIIKYAQKKNLSIPEDLEIIGCGNYPISRLIDPELTTVDLPFYEAGQLAAQSMVDLLEGKKDQVQYKLDVSLVERSSS